MDGYPAGVGLSSTRLVPVFHSEFADTVNPVGVAQALADTIRGARLATLDRCGHWATVERPDDCARRLGDFLARA